MPKVLLIHNIMAPYRFPLFRALAHKSGIDLTVWFMSESAPNRRWRLEEDIGFTYAVLPRIVLSYSSRDLFTYIVNYSFPLKYATTHFDVLIIAGWLDFACQAGFVLSKLLRRKYILWSESTAYEPSWRRDLAAPLVRTMVTHAHACVAVGTRSKDYLVSLGASPGDVFTAISTVDVAHFQRVSATWKPRRDELKAQFGITRRRVVLYVGQLIERKGLRYLIDAYDRLKRTYADVALVLLGYGPLRNELEETARMRGLPDVHFLGHMDVEQIPRAYAMADVFVLPSLEDTWGLVVNEAMACGLPVVVSERVGGSVDLVRDGENGFVVEAGDADALAERVGVLVRQPELAERLGACSMQLIQQFTPERAAHGFAAAVDHALQR
jgi:glycosyltransferase involved in cell wall biosynthesis